MPFLIEASVDGTNPKYLGLSPNYVGTGHCWVTKDDATVFRTWEEAHRIKETVPPTLRSRVVLTGVGYIVRVDVGYVGENPMQRYVGQDENGYHTTQRDRAIVFQTKDAAEDAVGSYQNHPGANPTLEWVGLDVPDWLQEGTRVSIGGEGALWKIAKVNGTEINLTAEGDDHPVIWGIDRFLAVWQPVRSSRFTREDPI